MRRGRAGRTITSRPVPPSTSTRTLRDRTGHVTELIADFHSTVLSNDRGIWAYLPPSYSENTRATYPVLYMHDGQNLLARSRSSPSAATMEGRRDARRRRRAGLDARRRWAPAGAVSRSAARPSRVPATVIARAASAARSPRRSSSSASITPRIGSTSTRRRPIRRRPAAAARDLYLSSSSRS